MATLGRRAFRSPLNPAWTAGQGLRGAGSALYSSMPAMSKLGDSLVDNLAGEGLAKAGEGVGRFLGSRASDLAGSLGSALGGAGTSAGLSVLAEGLDALGPLGALAGKAVQAASPAVGMVATGASKLAGLPLEAAGGAIGKAALPMLMKMGGRAGLGAAAEGLHGPGTLLSGGGEPGDMAMKQAAFFGSMPKMDMSPDKGVPPPAVVKPLNPFAMDRPLGDEAFDDDVPAPQEQSFSSPRSMMDGPGAGVDDTLNSAAAQSGVLKPKPIPPPSGPGVPRAGMYTSPDGGMMVGPATITTPRQPPDVSMDAEPTISSAESPLSYFKRKAESAAGLGRASRRRVR